MSETETETATYPLKSIPRELLDAATARARASGRSLRWIMLAAMRQYVARTWSPPAEDEPPPARLPRVPRIGRAPGTMPARPVRGRRRGREVTLR